MALTPDQRWLIALDIDGTLVHDDGYLSPRVAAEVKRVQDLGHLVVVATGRSAVNAIGVTKEIGLLDGKPRSPQRARSRHIHICLWVRPARRD
ncbi:MAG: hypothetical protein RL545_657, partial [Actinomycetota bacterium]